MDIAISMSNVKLPTVEWNKKIQETNIEFNKEIESLKKARTEIKLKMKN